MNAQTDRRLLYETFIVLALMVIPVFLWPQTKTLTALLVLAYLLIERRLRQRSWAEIGFKFRSFAQDLKANWILVILVGIVLQLLVLGMASRFWPAFLTHVQDRVAGVIGAQVPIMFGVLIFSTLLEELLYRALFQERFSRVFNPYVVLVVVSILFALMHWGEGALPLVLTDVGLIVVSSSLYGLIFLRGGNVLVAWLAHLLADVVGLIGLLWLI